MKKTHVNIGTAFQRWREIKEREGLESDAKVALILHCFTQLICVGFCLNMLMCHFRLCHDRCWKENGAVDNTKESLMNPTNKRVYPHREERMTHKLNW